MRRVVLALVAVVVCVVASQAQAAHVVRGWSPAVPVVHHHHGWHRPAFVHSPVFVRPPVVVPTYPRVWYPPVYSMPRVYYGGPSGSFYYNGPGVSLGIGF